MKTRRHRPGLGGGVFGEKGCQSGRWGEARRHPLPTPHRQPGHLEEAQPQFRDSAAPNPECPRPCQGALASPELPWSTFFKKHILLTFYFF